MHGNETGALEHVTIRDYHKTCSNERRIHFPKLAMKGLGSGNELYIHVHYVYSYEDTCM